MKATFTVSLVVVALMQQVMVDTASASQRGQVQVPAPPSRPQPTPAPQPGPVPTPGTVPILPEELATPPQLVNIKVDLAIIEEGGGEPMTRKDVSVTVADRREWVCSIWRNGVAGQTVRSGAAPR